MPGCTRLAARTCPRSRVIAETVTQKIARAVTRHRDIRVVASRTVRAMQCAPSCAHSWRPRGGGRGDHSGGGCDTTRRARGRIHARARARVYIHTVRKRAVTRMRPAAAAMTASGSPRCGGCGGPPTLCPGRCQRRPPGGPGTKTGHDAAQRGWGCHGFAEQDLDGHVPLVSRSRPSRQSVASVPRRLCTDSSRPRDSPAGVPLPMGFA